MMNALEYFLDGKISVLLQPSSIIHVGYNFKCILTIDNFDEEPSPTNFQQEGSRNSTKAQL